MPSKSPPQFVNFRYDSRQPVLTVMRSIAVERDGWINFAPSLELDELPETPSALSRVFGPKGPAIPFGTWVPGRASKRGGDSATSLGLQHGGGRHAIWRLRDAGVLVPSDWKVLGDNPRRGLVLSLPAGADPELALDWLLRAAVELTAIALEMTGDWRAAVHR